MSVNPTAPLLTLKIDVDTYRGTREGVPNLVRMLSKHGAHATFLFSLGPDHTGWALRRAFKPGFFSKVSRTLSSRVTPTTSRATVSNRPTRMRSCRSCTPSSERAGNGPRACSKAWLALSP